MVLLILRTVSQERMFKALSEIVRQISLGFLVNVEVSFDQVRDIGPIGKSAGKCKQMPRSNSSVISCNFESLDISTDTPFDLKSSTNLLKRLLPPSDSYHCEEGSTIGDGIAV